MKTRLVRVRGLKVRVRSSSRKRGSVPFLSLTLHSGEKKQWTHSQLSPALCLCWDNKHCRKGKGGDIYKREETCDMNIMESTGPTNMVELVSVSLHVYKTEKSSTIFIGKVLFKIFMSQVPILMRSTLVGRTEKRAPVSCLSP